MRLPRKPKDDERLKAAKEWQEEERAAARERLRELAETTPDPVRTQR